MNLMRCWLPDYDIPDTLQTPLDVARWELSQTGVDCALSVDAAMGDAYEILDGGRKITGGETGVLYGVYRCWS